VSDVVIAIEGLAALDFMVEIPKDIERAAYRALNKTASRARTAASRAIRAQVRFPASYIGPSSGRLTTVTAKKGDGLVAKVVGRDRPTSLARFVRGSGRPVRKAGGKRGLNVTVEKGGAAKFINRAFIINLRSGNKGFAVRTDGGKPGVAYKPKRIGKDGKLWLLYGPSVDQVLFSVTRQSGVFTDIGPETAEFLEREFRRLLDAEID